MRLFTNRGLRRAHELLETAQKANQAEQFAQAEESARQAVELYARAGRRGAEGVAVGRAALGRAARGQGRGAEAERELRAALTAPGITSAGRAAVRIELAHVLRADRRHAEALEEIRRAVVEARATMWLLGARQAHALLLGESGRHREAAEVLNSLAAECRRANPPLSQLALATGSNRLTHLAYLGEHAEVDQEVPRLRAAAGTVPEPAATLVWVSAANTLAMSRSLRGRHTEAEELLRETLAERGVPDSFALTLHINLSRALLGQGRPEEAGEAVEAARAIAAGMPALSENDRSALGLAAANVHLALGRPAEAEQEARQAMARCADAPAHRVLELRTALGIAKQRQGRGDSTLAGALADWRAHFGAEHHGTVAARQALAG
ncbi:tetratricopeptide repeat protein [Kitasatospora sp. NPDC004615]|uniref:tetratricopeptide repeat protein n=1 Tax=Kitasatospora sp. NPDC004615 TaxID=3364017 RepID=UPI0036A848E6